jgi:DNA-binding beta-propeller fold protein YncE
MRKSAKTLGRFIAGAVALITWLLAPPTMTLGPVLRLPTSTQTNKPARSTSTDTLCVVPGADLVFTFPALQNRKRIADAHSINHYEYVFPDSNIYVYDIDHGFKLIKHVAVPTSTGVRGAVASAATGMLYVSYGSTRDAGGSMLAYDLINDRVLWQKRYPFGIDSMSVGPDGCTIYMPTGELAWGGLWKVLEAMTGTVIGSIDSKGRGPHNTIVSPDGLHLYMGLRATDYVAVANTANYRLTGRIGPVSDGVRPFTINAAEKLCFITTSGFLGFQVGNVSSGKIVYTVPVRGFPAAGGRASAFSHGISLSPDEKEIYLVDSINSYIHVFDVRGLPSAGPMQVADIRLVHPLSGGESHCAQDCLKDGWIHHSRDGRYVFVGDSGDVIDTASRTIVSMLPAMADTRKEIEIDFQGGKPIWAMNNRSSVGMAPSAVRGTARSWMAYGAP